MIKYLGIIGNEGKLNKDAIQNYANHLKKIIAAGTPQATHSLKSHALLDLLFEVSLPLR